MFIKSKRFVLQMLSNIWFGIQTSYKASGFYFAMKVVILISTTVIPLVNIWLWKEILNCLTVDLKDYRIFFALIVVYLSLTICAYALRQFDEYVGKRYEDALQFYIDDVMMEKTSKMDLAFFDSANMGDKISHARQNFDIMTSLTWLIFGIVSEIINIVSTIIIVCMYKWWLGFVTILLLSPYLLYNKKHTERLLDIEKSQIRDKRFMEYYYDTFFNVDVQFEIKLNGIGHYMMNRFAEIWRRVFSFNRKVEIKHSLKNSIFSLISISSEILVLIMSVIDFIGSKIGIGDVQFNLSMVARLREQTSMFMSDINRLLVNNTRLMELRDFINLQPQIESSGSRKPSANPKIEFRNVSFRYPNAEQYILQDCSFCIAPNEKVGLIGLNGTGKSTILKLLFRFYDPEKGRILLDDHDLKEYDIYAVRKVFGVLFQECVTYCLPLREIIAMSEFESRMKDDKLQKACDVSGFTNVMKDWDRGFDTVIGRYYEDDGKDLSGGQWQLLGLARAYFKECNFMILDEPSAALDPISEDRIFEQLYKLSSGKSSITISHRLSNTKLADKILVLEDGHIIEQGTHNELLRNNGKYARLFNLQAAKYV